MRTWWKFWASWFFVKLIKILFFQNINKNKKLQIIILIIIKISK